MAEKVVSPGVFTSEIDESFLPAGIGEIGAAIVGPTVKGPGLVPTVVNTFSEFDSKFGTTFKSGSGYFQYLTSHAAENYLKNGNKLTVVRILDGSYSAAYQPIYKRNDDGTLKDGTTNEAFRVYTRDDGAILNNSGVSSYTHPTGSTSEGASNNILISGSKDNYRIEIANVNANRGTFNLVVRLGSDSINRKQVVETWNNVSLDPNASTYISKMIGDSYFTLAGSGTDEPYLTTTGNYPNKSKYIRVAEVSNTIDYLDENGNIRLNALSASLPANQSGSFFGGSNGVAGFDALGNISTGSTSTQIVYDFYDKIGTSNYQGYALSSGADGTTAYTDAFNMLKNQDEYDINLLLAPGLTAEKNGALVSKMISVCEDRADCFAIVDPVSYGNTITLTTQYANNHDSNYAAMYWPWVQIQDARLNGVYRWVPPSVVMGGIYAFNDRVAHPWFAPAGLNRGGIEGAIQAERKLTNSQRDTLYDSSVNPIATFPGQGVCVWGQKTLQKKASALDRVNVRRLLIKVKKFIASSSRFLVFEQNNAQLRKRFLNIANPFLEQVQSNSGLNAFKVVMDDTNNTPDLVDRNILYGQIFLQPTKTAEFIILDFTIQPTGAAFPE